MSMETSNLTKVTLSKMFEQGKRFDERDLLEYRDLEIIYDVSNKAEGTARVKLGKTDVIAGVKLEVGEPYPDSPNKGNLVVSADLLPLASPRFEAGPPGFDGIELPRLADRIIRNCGMLELSKLVLKEGEKVWSILIDIYPINDDGNLIDASTIAAIAALKKTVFPEIDKDFKIDYKTKTKKKLPLLEETLPISFSFYKLGNSIILDPTREEEEACDVRITFGASMLNDQLRINSCQKKGEATFSNEEISKLLDLIPEKFKELNKKLKKFL